MPQLETDTGGGAKLVGRFRGIVAAIGRAAPKHARGVAVEPKRGRELAATGH